ncbi:hypothetical protein AAE250_08425 [Bacteroides sp. GD17]|jgi:hypothetical protein|uniref:hypothetical protein n=1 Tax=Bacteroides sp. GD17 TaxID=3139826 RepID=UPI0026004D95|nr:hypothetical protein [uncultured Bacteroides sp.]
MKKILKLLGGFIVGACIGVIGAYVGTYIATGMSFETFGEKFVTIDVLQMAGIIGIAIAFLLLSVFLQIILHEGGHLVCGLATGYRFVSFRILSLTFIRLDGKLRIKNFSIAGTAGQCLLTPPDKPLQDIPYILYNSGGVLANLLTAAIAIILLLTVDEMPPLMEIFLLLFALVGIILGLMNGIPMKIGGVGNDAYNMRLLRRDERSKQAMVTMLRVNALIQEGIRPKDMPEEWFRQEYDIDYRNTLQVTIRLMYIGRLQDQFEWWDAYNALEEMMTHKDEIIGLLAKEIECEMVFTGLVIAEFEWVNKLYTKELSDYILQYKNVMSSKQRILCILALYHGNAEVEEAKEIYETVCRRKDKYLMQGEVNSDIAQMRSILADECIVPR